MLNAVYDYTIVLHCVQEPRGKFWYLNTPFSVFGPGRGVGSSSKQHHNSGQPEMV